jgi:hypothetical protein
MAEPNNIMTPEQRKVIDAAVVWHEERRHCVPFDLNYIDRRLFDIVGQMRFPSSPLTSPKPAPAVDLAALEKRLGECAIRVVEQERVCRLARELHDKDIAGRTLTRMIADYNAAKEALADARNPPAPKLLTAAQALETYDDGRYTNEDSMKAVLTAAHARVLAVIEALFEHEVPATTEDGDDGVIPCRSIEEIRRVLGGGQ